MNQQLFEKALKNFEQAAKLDPALDIARVNQGVALLNLGRIDPAKTLLDEAVKRNPKDPYAWYRLALLAKQQRSASGSRRLPPRDRNRSG